MFGLGFGELSILVIFVLAPAVAAWQIVAKAGYSGAFSLFLFLPLVNLIMLLVFANSDWPVLRELRALLANTPHSQ